MNVFSHECNNHLMLGKFTVRSIRRHIIISINDENLLYNIQIILIVYLYKQGFPGGSAVKNLLAIRETWVQSLGWENPLEKGIATHSSFLAWRTLWTEEPDSPWGHKQSDMMSEQISLYIYTYIHIHTFSGLLIMHSRAAYVGVCVCVCIQPPKCCLEIGLANLVFLSLLDMWLKQNKIFCVRR